MDRVRAIATRIHLAQLGGAPDSDLEIVQGMLRASRDQYVAGREQSASFTLEAVEGRLHRMAVYIPESTWVALILGVLTCLVRNRRRPDA